MRLLDAEALIYDDVAELVDFVDESHAPKYAILSHTWEEEEILFRDIPQGPGHRVRPSATCGRAARRQEVPAQHDPNRLENSEREATLDDIFMEEINGLDFSPSASGAHAAEWFTEDRNFRALLALPSPPGGFDHTNKNNLEQLVPHVKRGWDKVRNTCRQAVKDGLAYVWIDTCKSRSHLRDCHHDSGRLSGINYRLHRQK